MDEQKQICSKCNVEKSMDDYYFRNDTQKFYNQCKACMLIHQKSYESNNKEKIASRLANYYQNNEDKTAAKHAEYYQENKEKNAVYKQRNRDKINEYNRNRRRNDENVRLIDNTRTRIHNALNRRSKSLRTGEILGIGIENYKIWLLFQMTPEMNFNNIHIDHVKPISSFDISNDNELLEAFNWRNTQPLLKQDNLRKSAKFNEKDYAKQFKKAREFNLLQTFLSETNLL